MVHPLYDWLKDYNERNGLAGDTWSDECPTDLPEADTVDDAECKGDPSTGSTLDQLPLCLTLLLAMLIHIPKLFN
ncbi:hypothetical protein EB796_008285 [Bugula neritina]|uniref:Uncharacterized protein n=1 Tax=Bugula neritina TaxID=10212 RepID=A0A7J7K5D4_BUGNE|nr:hypothetical protein EB796_008285 [Bugula neritina]